MTNELHALVHAAKCLVLAQQQAADKVLTCGSRFLHPEADDQAGDMLACFAKVAATALFHRCVVSAYCNMDDGRAATASYEHGLEHASS